MPQQRRIHVVTNTKAEASTIERALTNPVVRAFVLICGTLDELPSKAAQQRVLDYVERLSRDPDYWKQQADKFAEPTV